MEALRFRAEALRKVRDFFHERGVLEVETPALSRGVSLQGYQDGEPCGSLTTKAPSSVGTQPSMAPSGSVIGSGTPE